jgi:mannan endo-1,4-beta-mannosidase
VLPVLEDGPGYCTTTDKATAKSDYADDTWFATGYRAQYGTAPMSFRDYAKVVTEHYRDEPTILGWSLINEADTSRRDPTGRSVLVQFARDMGQVVRTADPNHLITLGTQSNGASGASGPDFTAVYSQPELDFAEVHDWEPWGDRTDPMPGGRDGEPPAPDDPACADINAPIACSFALSVPLDKPLLVGESGIEATTPAAREVRAQQLGAKMHAAIDAGAGGYLLWRVTKEHEDIHDITLESHDPVLGQIAQVAAELDGR